MHEGSWQAYDVVVDRDVCMTLRDGVRLVSDVYRPASDGRAIEEPLPVLVERTPYDKGRTAAVSTAKYFARRGYVVVIQDVRGRYGSDGEWWAFADEGEDGFDTVEWIATQPWCNGKIGTIGLSYSASNQSATASLAPPHLGAMFVSQGMSNYHTVGMRQGGALEGRFFVSWFMLGARSKEAQADPLARAALSDAFANVRQWLSHTPYTAGTTPLRHAPIYERWLLEVQRRADYDDFWLARGLNIEPYYDQHADVPVFLLGGWYDTYTRATTDNFIELRTRKDRARSTCSSDRGRTARTPSHFRSPATWILAPTPRSRTTTACACAGSTPRSRASARGVLDDPPVRLFVMGGGSGRRTDEGRMAHGGRWRDESEWPLARAVDTHVLPASDGSLSPDQPIEDVSASRYTYDPRDPVPTIGGNISAAPDVLPAGAFDQRCRHRLVWVLRSTAPGCAAGCPRCSRPRL